MTYSIVGLDSVVQAGLPIEGLIYEKLNFPRNYHKLVYYLGMLASQGRYDFMNEFRLSDGGDIMADILSHFRAKELRIDTVMFRCGFEDFSSFRSAFQKANVHLLPVIRNIIFDYMDRTIV